MAFFTDVLHSIVCWTYHQQESKPFVSTKSQIWEMNELGAAEAFNCSQDDQMDYTDGSITSLEADSDSCAVDACQACSYKIATTDGVRSAPFTRFRLASNSTASSLSSLSEDSTCRFVQKRHDKFDRNDREEINDRDEPGVLDDSLVARTPYLNLKNAYSSHAYKIKTAKPNTRRSQMSEAEMLEYMFSLANKGANTPYSRREKSVVRFCL